MASSSIVANVNYTVQGTDVNGCVNTAVVVIKVNSCIGLDESTETRFQVFPNPSKGLFYVEVPEVNNMNLAVYNVLGQEIYKCSAQSLQTIDLSKFSQGIYTLRIYHHNTVVGQQRLIRQ